ncbi:MAG: 6-phosphogluconate dehydrogenase [Alphaproteobacteria bacterium]|jgi:3-hydroxyisobutyrate dehydrogenase-like beta-hydroxyacid dehydrogenase|nr:6-phosphogluconate dehydrogenase [Alphaproteobacteria bacterium]PPR13434.1 MAG: 2-hydroxy-3-oxopropionate reductase [Alphaproteobacteria bacterium MarineAlpha12_Bin1]|tara:strand:+ start:4987 stop:5868 length:882 start_codon:yes stop_codon:yes gene_type:complete
MKVGFIGAGIMGSGMVRNLLSSGHEVTVFNRTQSKAKLLARDGAKVVNAAIETVDGAEILITILGGDESVSEVLFGEQDLITALPKGSVHVSMETISVTYSRILTDTHKSRNKGFVAAPIIGRGDAAELGELTLIVGGATEDINRCLPAFEAMSKNIVHVGENPESAAFVKLSNNYLIAGALAAMGEAFAVVRKAGVDPNVFYELITTTMFSAPIYSYYGKNIAADIHTPPNFRSSLGLKDINQTIESARGIGVPMPLAELVKSQIQQTIENGDQDLDWSCVARVAAKAAGLK